MVEPAGRQPEAAHPDVVNSRCRQPPLPLLTTELRVVTAGGKRSNVNHASDTRTIEQRGEPLGRQRAVPNGVQRCHRGFWELQLESSVVRW